MFLYVLIYPMLALFMLYSSTVKRELQYSYSTNCCTNITFTFPVLSLLEVSPNLPFYKLFKNNVNRFCL